MHRANLEVIPRLLANNGLVERPFFLPICYSTTDGLEALAVHMLRETPLSFLEHRRLGGNHTTRTIALTPPSHHNGTYYCADYNTPLAKRKGRRSKSDESEEDRMHFEVGNHARSSMMYD
jgi:hypothetical protein